MQAYRDYYTHEMPPSFSVLPAAAKIRRALANGYRNWRYGTREYPASSWGVVFAMLSPNARADLDRGMRHLPKPAPGQRLLDIGCGNGAFLRRAQSAGWTAVGLDADPKAVQAAIESGLDVRNLSVDELDSEAEQFDVITMSHVIEHVHDPIGVLRSCYRLLKPNGMLWIETPNLDSTGHRVYGPSWRGLEPPRHLVLFTHGSLGFAMRRAGFLEFETLPYVPLCVEMFRASTAIERGISLSSTEGAKLSPSENVRQAERIAKADATKREFVAIRAWKR